jgi:hypothetical protein
MDNRLTIARLRTELRDLFELVLLPGLAAALPWALCFRLFRYLCRAGFLYREACDEAFAQAQSRGWVRGDAASWRQRHRLVMLIDHADYYLELTRSDRWMARHLLVSGSWPDPARPAILCTFHWGAGMWALRHVEAQGLHVHLLIAPHSRASFPGRSVRSWYYRRRIRAIPRALGREPIEATSSPRPILHALRASEQVAAVVDVPADQVAASLAIDFLGSRVRMPRGLLRMACDSGVPVTVYLLGIRLSDGKRPLRIHQLDAHADVESLAREVFSHLEAAVAEESSAWHFWSIAPRFFEQAGADGRS